MNYSYIRVSTDKQELKYQQHEILEYCRFKGLELSNKNTFQETISTKKHKDDRQELARLLEVIKQDDTIIISELSRLGRDTIEVLTTVKQLLQKNIELRLVKENLIINGADSLTAKMVLPMLSAINEMERDRISQRTKQALATRKAAGVTLGRPKGSFSGSKLDQHQETIKEFRGKGVSIQSMARILGTSKQNLSKYIKLREL